MNKISNIRNLFSIFITALIAGCVTHTSLPDDGFVDVSGGRIAFRIIGKDASVPVLVIHGGPGSSSCSYPSTFTGIASGRQVIMYDQLGSGYSDRIIDLNKHAVLSRFVSEVRAIREELGVKKLHIVGHSWGAAIAMEYLLTEEAEGVLSIIFVGPLLGTERWIQDANSLVATLPIETQEVIHSASESGDYSTPEFKAADNVFWSKFGVRTPTDELDKSDCDISPKGDSGLYNYMWGPSEFLSTGTLRDYNRIDRLSSLKIPTLFLVGQYDEAKPETMLEFQALVPGSIVTVIPNAGHMVNIDQPKLFNDAINNFFTKVEGDN